MLVALTFSKNKPKFVLVHRIEIELFITVTSEYNINNKANMEVRHARPLG
jgi:hypothetical protein